MSDDQLAELERIREWACCMEPERRFMAEIDLNKEREKTKEISALYEQLQAENAALKRENEQLRKFVELTQTKWEEFGCDDGIVTVKYPWTIQERMREIALLAQEQDDE